MTDYATFLAQLYLRQRNGARLGLERIESLLERLGRPHDAVPSIVVAGTNGKGSTSYLLARALQAAGHRVGLFTSPHLLRFAERMQIQGEPISQDTALALGQQILTEAQAADQGATFFEITTALALTWFSQASVDVAVLEVGLGGRFDATNVVRKEMAVITPISRDHEARLGCTLTAIAAQKAGIIGRFKPVVLAPQPRSARKVVMAEAAALKATVYQVRRPPRASTAWMPPYQHINFATAQEACRVLHAVGRFACPPAAFATAVKNFAWPGRYHWLWPGQTTGVSPPCPVVLDGGHNPAGAQALSDALAVDSRVRGRRVHVLFAVVQDKDCVGMLDALRPIAASWRVCGLQSTRQRDPEELARQVGPRTRAFTNFKAAWADLLALPARSDDLIVVTGSLFLVADALAHLAAWPRDRPIDA